MLALLLLGCPPAPGPSPTATDEPTDTGDIPTDTDTPPELPSDSVVFRSGQVIDGLEYRDVWGFALALDGTALWSTLVFDQDTWVGSAILRQRHDGEPEVVVSPSELEAVFGEPSISGSLRGDRSGTVHFRSTSGCLGLWDGSLHHLGCEGTLLPGEEGSVLIQSPSDDPQVDWELHRVSPSASTLMAHEGWEPVGNPVIGRLDRIEEHRIGTRGEVWALANGSAATTPGDGVLALTSLEGPGTTGSNAAWWQFSFPVEASVGLELPAGPFSGTWGYTVSGMVVAGDGGVSWLTTLPAADGVYPGTGLYGVDADGAPRTHVDLTQPLPTRTGASLVDFRGTSRTATFAYDIGTDGRLWLLALLEDGTTGIWRESDVGTLNLVVASGDPVPGADGRPLDGLTFAKLGSPVSSGGDSLVFTASITGTDVDDDNRHGVWGIGRNEDLRLLARTGDPMPGGEEPIERLSVHGLLVPDGLNPDGIGLSAVEVGNSQSHAAFGSYGTGSTVRPTTCGEALIAADSYLGWTLSRVVVDRQCSGGHVVNVTTDAPDTDPGDGRCDVGGPAVDSRRPCSFRAALQEAEAREGTDQITFDLPGAGPHTLAVTSALPVLHESLMVFAESEVVVLDGSGLDAPGLVIEDGAIELQGIDVAGFGQAGIETDATYNLKLYGVEIRDNCGWGIQGSGVVRFMEDDRRSLVAENGTRPGCTGGGLAIAHDDETIDHSVHLRNVTVRDNGGPGVLANASVTANHAVISGNAGQGLSVQSMDDGPLRFRLSLLDGDLEVRDNAGHGIELEGGGVFAPHSTVRSIDNGAWGIWLDQGQTRLGHFGGSARTDPHLVTGNGTGSSCSRWTLGDGGTATREEVPCGGGGIAILEWVPSGTEPSLVDLAEVRDNAGPGILSTDALQISRATITGNAGEGIRGVGEDPPMQLHFGLGPNRVATNQGAGAHLELGPITSEDTLEVVDNGGWGLRTEEDAIRLPSSAAPSWTTTVTGNGAGTSCIQWTVDGTGTPSSSTGACSGGGVHAADGDIHGIQLVVTGNTGVGLEAHAGAYGDGDIDLLLGQLCGNTGGDTLADGTVTTDTVNTICP